MSPHEHPIERLLNEHAFVRRLARSLVTSEHDADDLEQQAWIAALQRTPSMVQDVRAWLARVVRNVARNTSRGERRRGEREVVAARREAAPDPAGVDRELDLHEQVVVAMRSVPEPFRTALYMRYYQDLSPSEIARRIAAPLPTIKSRLVRGRQLIRDSLDRHHDGDRRAWSLPVLLLAKTTGKALPTSGAVIMGMSAMIKIVAVALAAVGLFCLWPDDAFGDGSASLETSVASGEGQVAAPAEALPTSGHEDREEVESPPAGIAGAEKRTIRARVLDAGGVGLAGVRIEFRRRRGTVVEAVSGAGGLLVFDHAPGAGRLVCAERHLVTVLEPQIDPRHVPREAAVVVAPRMSFKGSVIDEFGAHVEGAEVLVRLPRHFRARFGVVLDEALVVRPRTRTDGRGRFELSEVPRVRDAVFTVRAAGYARHAEALPSHSADNLVITLHRPGASNRLTGLVVDKNHTPVEGARVSFGGEVARTDAAGAFSLDTKDDARSTAWRSSKLDELPKVVFAVLEGHLPASHRIEVDASGRELWPERLVLRLGDEPKKISGRVVDQNGEPLGNVRVWLDNPLFFSVRDKCHVEALVAGMTKRDDMLIRTEKDGRFEIGGLQDREYRVGAVDFTTFLRTYTPITPGRDADTVIVLDTSQVLEEAHGHVVTPDGEPVPSVAINVMADLFRPILAGREVRYSSWLSGRARAQADGSFTLRRLPKRGVYLYVTGDAIFTRYVGRGDAKTMGGLAHLDPKDMRIVVERRHHVRVVLTDPTLAERVSAVDAAGGAARVYLLDIKQDQGQEYAPIANGRTRVFAVKGTVRLLVLWTGEREVARLPVQPRAGEIVEVRF